MILKKAAGPISIWNVPVTGHTGAMMTHPVDFERRVIDLFAKAAR